MWRPWFFRTGWSHRNLAEDWHGMSTKVINEGGGGDNVNEHTFEWSFGTTLGNDQRIFCEPVSKN